tara:strand:+ start:609 stop:977 length:369 start_codon:yes stop_codon:yes gene_type:complete
MFHDALPLLIGFLVKHLLADYFMQYSWMIREKGNYGSIKGIAHSGLHAIFTFTLLWWYGFSFWWSLLMGLLDGIFHYHIDFVKSNLWKNTNLGPNDQAYWMIHGTDQFLHMMTYVLILHFSF